MLTVFLSYAYSGEQPSGIPDYNVLANYEAEQQPTKPAYELALDIFKAKWTLTFEKNMHKDWFRDIFLKFEALAKARYGNLMISEKNLLTKETLDQLEVVDPTSNWENWPQIMYMLDCHWFVMFKIAEMQQEDPEDEDRDFAYQCSKLFYGKCDDLTAEMRKYVAQNTKTQNMCFPRFFNYDEFILKPFLGRELFEEQV